MPGEDQWLPATATLVAQVFQVTMGGSQASPLSQSLLDNIYIVAADPTRGTSESSSVPDPSVSRAIVYSKVVPTWIP